MDRTTFDGSWGSFAFSPAECDFCREARTRASPQQEHTVGWEEIGPRADGVGQQLFRGTGLSGTRFYKEFVMHSRSLRFRTSCAVAAAAATAGAADAAIVVFDSFSAGSQSVIAAGSIVTSAATAVNTSTTNASIAATAGSRNQRASRAAWDTALNATGLTDAEKAARFASTVVDSSTGVASLSFGGRVSNASSVVQYLAAAGAYMDLSGYQGVQLDGALVSSGGLGITSVVNVDVILVDANGVTASHYFSASDADGGFTALNGILSANFADFFASNPFDPFWYGSIDLTQIASFAVNFSYYDGSFGASAVSGTYQLGQIGLISTAVPAPGALALLTVVGLATSGRRRR